MKDFTRHIEPGTPQPDLKYHIDILPEGPFLVYGNPPLHQEVLISNDENISWEYAKGQEYSTQHEPTALCRCGHSKKNPYCDGTHQHCQWDPTLTADNIPLLEKAELYDGPTVQLTDNTKYCVHARICMAEGGVWELTEKSDNMASRDLAIHETMYCPSGRLKIWDKQEEKFIEPPLKPELGLIEDPQEKCSGPLWVKGGIPINGPDSTLYEQRNRVTLCRCGASHNKPFCDSSHVTARFQDNLPLAYLKKEDL